MRLWTLDFLGYVSWIIGKAASELLLAELTIHPHTHTQHINKHLKNGIKICFR